MDTQLQDIAYLIQFRNLMNAKVSEAPVAWHLDHSLKVINKILNVLKNSDPSMYTKRFSLKRSFSFTFGYIPRGRAKSPAAVLPPHKISTKELLSQVEEARDNLKNLRALDKNSNFIHPVFGQLNTKQSKRFLELHTRHHLKIVRDILGEDEG